MMASTICMICMIQTLAQQVSILCTRTMVPGTVYDVYDALIVYHDRSDFVHASDNCYTCPYIAHQLWYVMTVEHCPFFIRPARDRNNRAIFARG